MARSAGSRDTGGQRAAAILRLLQEHYPDARCTLDFQTPLQLLVATILSAQCTDERVNRVTPGLFRKYPDAEAYASAPLPELEADVRSTGFYRNKAKAIQACCRELRDRHGGEVPADLEALVRLPGVGRKTANVVLGNAFGVPGITVDTHVARVAQRLGLTRERDPEKIERDLMALVPRERWTRASHQLILHGRTVCQARRPRCGACPLQTYSEYFAQTVGGQAGGGRARRAPS